MCKERGQEALCREYWSRQMPEYIKQGNPGIQHKGRGWIYVTEDRFGENGEFPDEQSRW